MKNYNIGNNTAQLISDTCTQAIKQAAQLPEGSSQSVVIDITGQLVTEAQRDAIQNGIVASSNGIISAANVKFFPL